MKKKIYLMIAGLALTAPAMAQHSYVRFGAGYQFPATRQEMPVTNYDYNKGKSRYEESVARYSLHKGIEPVVSFGHMFNANIGFELGVSYLLGAQGKAWQGVTLGGVKVYNELTRKATNINILPALRLAVPLGKDISLYSRTGVVIPVLARIKDQFVSEGYDTTGAFQKVRMKEETKTRLTAGFTGAVGFEIKLYPDVSFFIEGNGQLLNVWSRSSTVTEYTVNGKDQMNTLLPYQKETTYLKSLHNLANNGNSPYQPAEVLTYQSPFTSVGLNVGLNIRL